MKPTKRTALAIRMFLAFIVLTSWVFSKEDPFATTRQTLGKQTALQGPTRSMMNINNIVINVDREGFFPWDGTATGTAGQYPKGTGGLIFAEGMLWGAKVSDGGAVRLRVNGCTYASGLKAGKVIYDANGNVIGSEDPSNRHVWRVRTDYKTADLSSDAAYFFVKSLSAVTEADIQDVYEQYDYDWNNWPASEGAPFKDVNGNGVYDPAYDIPGEPGASQTIWLVANDVPKIVDPVSGDSTGNQETASNSYGSPATGMELQLTLWAYDYAATNPLGNMMFKRARLIYTGLPGGPSNAKLDTVYFTQWSDPDLGTYTDDYVGCDVDLSLGYVYNGNTLDNQFYGEYGLPVPAGGYDFLQGPIVNGDTLGMTSFTYFGAGSAISDPDLGIYPGTLQFFNLMEGFLPRPEYPEQEPWTDPSTGDTTKFVLSGDPVTGEGWVDGIQLPPGDRRLVMATGPFEMALGDTQDVVLALIGALGSDNLNSVDKLKYYDKFAQLAYDEKFVLWQAPAKPLVSAYGGDGVVSLYWSADLASIEATEKTVRRGMAFEGYNIYQLPSTTASVDEGVKLATYDVINGVKTILEVVEGPEIGIELEVVAQEGTDSGISRSMVLDWDYVRSRPISNDITYYYGVSAYSVYDSTKDAPGAVVPPFKHLESGLSVVSVMPQQAPPGTRFGADVGDEIDVTHDSGASDGQVKVVVIDLEELTGNDYQVFFEQDTDSTSETFGELLWSVKDVTQSVVKLANQVQVADPDVYVDQPIIDGIQVRVAGPPLTVKDWEWEDVGSVSPLYPDYARGRWISGYDWGGNALFGGFGMAHLFWGADPGVDPADFHKVELRFTSMTSYDDLDGDGEYTIGYGDMGEGEPYYFDTSQGQKAFMYKTWETGTGNYNGFNDIPFQAWDVEDPNNPRQLNVVIRDRDQNTRWDIGPDLPYNYVWILADDYDPTGARWDPANGSDNDFFALLLSDGVVPSYYVLWAKPRGSRPFLARDGILRVYPNYVNTLQDKFTFSVPKTEESKELAKEDVENINAFPNPYYGFHILEGTRGAKWIRFNHLPQKAVIRIFNLGGNMVKIIEKDDDSQYIEWDVKNQNGYPVASGIYIVHIDLPDQGKSKILKLAIVQEEQILQNY